MAQAHSCALRLVRCLCCAHGGYQQFTPVSAGRLLSIFCRNSCDECREDKSEIDVEAALYVLFGWGNAASAKS